MEFKKYDMPGNAFSAVYLLFDDDEVVYVGQTTNGLRRLLQHNDKIFNKYAIIETSVEELEYYEDYYMMKYKPKYNNNYNYYRMSINSCYSRLRTCIQRQINIEQLKKFIKELEIEIINFRGKDTFPKKDFPYICEKLEEKYGNK